MTSTPEQRQAQRDANFGLPGAPAITPEQRAANGRKLRGQGRGITSPTLRGKAK